MRLSAISINDYRLELSDGKLVTEGPHERLAQMLGERWLHLIKTEEGQALHVHEEAADLLASSLGIPPEAKSISKKPRPATERQIEYAESIGYEFPEDITFDEVSIILTDYDCVRLFIHHSWKDLTGRNCADSGLSRDDLLKCSQGILQDEILTMRIRAISALAQLESNGLPAEGRAIEEVRTLLQKEFKQFMPRKLFGLFGK